MEYCRCISVTFLLLLLSLCVDKTTGNNQRAFEEFSKMHTRWLHIIANPDIAVSSRNSLFSYGLSESTNTTPVSAYRAQKLNNSTDPVLSLNSPSLSSRSKCAIDILYTVGNLEKQWALQMLDSAGKIPSAIFRGNVMWIGNYKECVDVYAPPRSLLNISFGNFHGQYCVTSWTINIPSSGIPPIPLKSSLCLPDTCNASSIENDYRFISSLIDLLPYVKEYNSFLSLDSFTCKPLSTTLDHPAIYFLIVLGIFGIIILLGSLITVIEIFMPSANDKHNLKRTYEHDIKEPLLEEGTFEEPPSTSYEEHLIAIGKTEDVNDDKITLSDGRECRISFQKHPIFRVPNCCIGIFCWIKRILKCFCVFTNGSKILNTSSGEQLLCIHGIRFLSMTWIILGHTYVFVALEVENIVDVVHDIDNWPFQVVMQGTFSVDSFFLLSGFLVTYLFLKRTNRTEKINWLYFYIHRYWRLTPVYMLLLGFNTAIFRYLGFGPFWADEGTDTAICRKNWWWNLLYINNFLDITKMCVSWSWYLANDMQFYVISPLFLYILWRWPKIGLSIISGLLGLSWITTGWISAKYKVLPLFTGMTDIGNYTDYEKRISDSMNMIYIKPYCRIGPYLIGAILAFLVLKAGDKKNFLKIWQQVLGWCSAAFFSLSVIYGLYHVEMNQTLFDFYNALSRSSYSLGLAWVIFACLTGHGGFINKILSLKLWIPLSRLTYCAYLVHPLIMMWFYQTLQMTIYFTHTTMVIYFLAFLTWIYGFAFILSLAFESPMMNLEKLIVNRNS